MEIIFTLANVILKILLKHVKGTSRCLPFLIAGNPVNFAKPTELSTVEALAGALFIAGFEDEATNLLSMFKWGHTFKELNQELLESYSKAKESSEIIEMQAEFISKIEKSKTQQRDQVSKRAR